VQQEPWRRARLQALIARFRSGAAAAGLVVGQSRTPIQPIILGDSALCLQASSRLRDAGYWVSAIRPPTVPPGTERLRITLSAAHSEAEVDGLVTALRDALPPKAAP
jgi:8-amino-7-oxononanoate synthase